jgi:hypothetical protein
MNGSLGPNSFGLFASHDPQGAAPQDPSRMKICIASNNGNPIYQLPTEIVQRITGMFVPSANLEGVLPLEEIDRRLAKPRILLK